MNEHVHGTDAGAIPLIAPELVEVDSSGRPRLKIGCCRACSALSFPASRVCGECLSLDIVDTTTDGAGDLYAYSVVHQAPKGWIVPYALGYVDLPNGLRIFGHIDCDFAKLRSGLKVELGLGVVRNAPDGSPRASYVFKPAE